MEFKKMNTLDAILDSKEFNEMFDFIQEEKDLNETGWTIQEVRNFAHSLTNKNNEKH